MAPLRVMIVEDEAIILMQLEALLEDAGHDVVATAMSADEAVALFAQVRPELVLLDLQLRDGSSGLDVANAIRHRDGAMVVFLTANARKLADDMEGADAVIAKPFNEATFDWCIAYLEECVHRPPPAGTLPTGLRLAPALVERLDRIRAV